MSEGMKAAHQLGNARNGQGFHSFNARIDRSHKALAL
jgi:hypothetical protein